MAQITIQDLQTTGQLLAYASPYQQDNYNCVLAAVNQDGLALQYASSRLQDDASLAIIAIKNSFCGDALAYVSERLLHDTNIYAVKQETKTNHETAMSNIIYTNPMLLENADNFLKNYKPFILRVVKMNGMALQFASESLKNDIDVIDAANNQPNRNINNIINII
jgi:hypothetical protein